MGSVASIVVASPFDVVKTRLQKGEFTSDLKARKVFREILAKEGPSAFFKGLTPKVGATSPTSAVYRPLPLRCSLLAPS